MAGVVLGILTPLVFDVFSRLYEICTDPAAVSQLLHTSAKSFFIFVGSAYDEEEKFDSLLQKLKRIPIAWQFEEVCVIMLQLLVSHNQLSIRFYNRSTLKRCTMTFTSIRSQS